MADQGKQFYKVKRVEFLKRRNVPIVLQNENGPCPLIAISNVLLLRNNIHIHPDRSEISHEDLLSYVAHRLLDTNASSQSTDSALLENQQKNVSDVITMLPRLATGIDVNVRFSSITAFEFTPETAIFDLLDISLVHGWLVDPQDSATAAVIGQHSYNSLVEKLVSLQEKHPELLNLQEKDKEVESAKEEGATLFPERSMLKSANTTAPLVGENKSTAGEVYLVMEGLPELKVGKAEEKEKEELDSVLLDTGVEKAKVSKDADEDGPSLVSIGRGFKEESKGDYEGVEEEEGPSLASIGRGFKEGSDDEEEEDEEDGPCLSSIGRAKSAFGGYEEIVQRVNQSLELSKSEAKAGAEEGDSNAGGAVGVGEEVDFRKALQMSLSQFQPSQNVPERSGDEQFSQDASDGLFLDDEPEDDDVAASADEDLGSLAVKGGTDEIPPSLRVWLDPGEVVADQVRRNSGTLSPRIIASGPLDEGDEEAEDDGEAKEQDLEEEKKDKSKEEKVEGEKEGGESVVGLTNVKGKGKAEEEERLSNGVSEGVLVHNFLSSSASQLTYHGLFSLQEGLKERELAVFFRNNHFNTIFKYEGGLFLLATDMGYFNQPNLVWEKLSEVDGSSEFTSGEMGAFKADSIPNSWVEDHETALAVAASSDEVANANRPDSYNPDLELAYALQQQEYENQRQQQARQRPSNSTAAAQSTGGMAVGPQRGIPLPKPKEKEKKPGDNCVIM